MKTEQIAAVEAVLGDIPSGCLRENGRDHRHPGWQGRGNSETFSLFPGVRLTWLWVRGEELDHRHGAGDGLELTHCRRGRVGWEMSQGRTLYLGPGDLAVHPMDCCAQSVLRLPLDYYEGLSVSLDLEALAARLPPVLALGGFDPRALRPTLCPEGKPAAFPPQPALDHIFLPLYDLPPALRLPYYQLKVQELLLFLSRQTAPAAPSNQYLAQQVAVVRAVHDQLMAAPHQRRTIEELAREHHMNTSTLKAVFKAVYGQPIAAHMKHHRMQEAARLLRESDESIGEIARQVGYENQSKFSAAFREVYQLLPTQYRKQRT